MTLLKKCLFLVEPGTRQRWLLLVLLAVLSSALEAGGAVLTVRLLQAVNGSGSIDGIPWFGQIDPGAEMYVFFGLCALFFLVRAATLIGQAYAQHRIAGNAGVRLSARLHHAYLTMPYDLYVQRNSSELIRTAQTSVEVVVRFLFVPGVLFCADAALVVAIAAVLLAVQPAATLIAAGGLVLVVVPVQRLVRPQLLRLGRISEETSETALKSLQQSLQGAREVKLFGSHAQFQRDYLWHRSEYAQAYYARSTLEAVPRVTVETSFILLVLVFLMASLAQGGDLTEVVSGLGLFAYAVLRVLPAVNRMLAAVNNMKYGTAAIDNVYDDLRDAAAWRPAQPTAPLSPTTAILGEVEFHRVSYQYPGSDRPAVEDLSFAVRRGESIGVVGPTGGGKSTVIDLLLGLLTPSAGTVTVDGRDVGTDAPAWHAAVGVVSQTVFLLDDTLRRNIAFGVDDADVSDERVREVARMAQIDDLLTELPYGLDTTVGERGVRLSGGQRQRIGIARALYRDPVLLVMDEGTSALDNITESEVMGALSALRGSLTLVTVAHRLTTVQACDRILYIEGGRAVDFASYDELLGRHEEFRRMAR